MESETNGLDIEAINPVKDGKYSPNLYRWLKKRDEIHRAWNSRVFRDSKGVLWVGVLDDCYLIGAKLVGVLCNGTKEQSRAYPQGGNLEEIADFWPRYIRDGRCAIDTDHSMYFMGDEGRWSIDGETRRCLWCGNATQTLRHWQETVDRRRWENVPSLPPAA